MPAAGPTQAASLTVLAGGCLLLLLLLLVLWLGSPTRGEQVRLQRSPGRRRGVSLRPHLLVLVTAPLLAGIVLLMLAVTHPRHSAGAAGVHLASPSLVAAVAVLGVALFYALRRGG